MEPIISIIVPIYNAEKNITKCVESILSQSFDNWELILVNDGSKDSSSIICENYAKQHSNIIVIHKPNGGVSSARNEGLKIANGQYITFADADDYLEPYTFELFFQTINTYKCDIVRSGYVRELRDDKEYVQIDKTTVCENTWDMFRYTELNNYYSFVWNTCFKKECIEGLWFNEDINWQEDHLFTYQAYHNCKRMVIIPEITYHYTIQSGGSLSDISDPDMIWKVAKLVLHEKKRLVKDKDPEMLESAKLDFAYRIHSFIYHLYSNNTSYNQRWKYSKGNIEGVQLIYKEEKVFFNQVIPFPIRDLILRCLSQIKKMRYAS